MASIDAEVVKHALQVARDYGFAEVELVNGDSQFRASLEPVRKKAVATPLPGFEDSTSDLQLPEIKSNFVGYIRLEDSKLSEGHAVSSGEVVAIVSTLGLENEVESLVAGEVVEVMVKDGDAVQFGQVLAKVKP